MDIGTLTIEYWVNKWQGGHCFGENNGAKYILSNAIYDFQKELILGRRHICYLMCVLHLELHVQGVH